MKPAVKSKTILFSAALAVLGVVEMNLHLVQAQLGDAYGWSYIAIAAIVAALRIVTTQPIGKEEEGGHD